MSDAPSDIPQRKLEHIEITARQPVTGSTAAGWADIRLLHACLPEVDKDAIDLSVEFLGRRLRAPLIIAGMTGGHPQAAAINATLARAVEAFGLGMGVGSQRAALRSPALMSTYTVAREHAPTALLMGNVGLPQLIDQPNQPALTLAELERAVEAIRADALVVHLNYLQEVVQPEGETRARGALAALARLCAALSVPVVAKETGAGMTRQQAERLRDAGVRALDVGGAGGTSFALVEAQRARARGKPLSERLGQLFAGWGIPTAVSVVETAGLGLPVIATGGIRSGLDAAKALALGATVVGVAQPALSAALEGDEALHRWLEGFLEELRVALFLTGSPDIATLRRQPRIILGETRAWLRQLGHPIP
ncbi:MAG TPA: type 2 isopentenyl-diphosphate Delta-isomerase [Chloroflexota bacterium]|nr:type 2 isopentenyl-diphosphate Delta-isomerase [Chloroflexota bacterium]